MDDRNNSEFMHDLRITINYIGTESLTALLSSSSTDVYVDPAMLNKLLDLLKTLANGQVSPYKHRRIVGELPCDFERPLSPRNVKVLRSLLTFLRPTDRFCMKLVSPTWARAITEGASEKAHFFEAILFGCSLFHM